MSRNTLTAVTSRRLPGLAHGESADSGPGDAIDLDATGRADQDAAVRRDGQARGLLGRLPRPNHAAVRVEHADLAIAQCVDHAAGADGHPRQRLLELPGRFRGPPASPLAHSGVVAYP